MLEIGFYRLSWKLENVSTVGASRMHEIVVPASAHALDILLNCTGNYVGSFVGEQLAVSNIVCY